MLSNYWLTLYLTINDFYLSTIVGVRCKDGVVLGTEKIVVNKMLLPGTDKRIFSIDLQTGCVRDQIIVK